MDSTQPEPPKELQDFPSRPQKSVNFSAKPVTLRSNHFTLSLSPNHEEIQLYYIKILDVEKDEQIPGDARVKRHKIMGVAFNQLKEIFGASFYYSGEVLWSQKKHDDGAKNIEVTYEKKAYLISLTWTRETNLRPETLMKDPKIAAATVQYMNLPVKKYYKLNGYKEWDFNAKFYDPDSSVKLGNFPLFIYQGYKTSCEIYHGFIPKMKIDVVSRIVREDNVLADIEKAGSSQKARELLKGKSVMAVYGNYKMWRIDDVDFTRNPRTKFLQNGKEISLEKYFKEKYGIKVRHMDQPILVHRNRKTGQESLLLPELVRLTGLSDEMVQNPALMKEVAQFTRLSPMERVQKIMRQREALAEFLSEEFDMKMEAQNSVKAYRLKAPKLRFGGVIFEPDQGNYKLKNPVFQPAEFRNWLFVYSEACKNEAKKFVECLIKCSGTFAIKVHGPTMIAIKEKKATVLIETIKKNYKKGTQIVVAMYPEIAKNHWYKALKAVCYQKEGGLGVPCQAVISSTVEKNTMSVCSTILLQMQAKIGKALWATEIPKGLPEHTMIIGADVFHSTKVGEEKKSCIGFCSSLDREFTQFFSKVVLQKEVGEEVMRNIGDLVLEAVKEYWLFNGKKFFPEYIIFYRDGVGESQLKPVLKFETQYILDKLQSLSKDYAFKFAEIIVTKRIDDRVFTTREEAGSQRYSNPEAGTLVTEGIVSNHFDFLLVSQNVKEGTCTPTHYNVIYDSTGLPEDLFEQLTYNQCYNYYNWTGSVKVPAPVQYAHKLAYLAGQTLQGEVKPELQRSLYYL